MMTYKRNTELEAWNLLQVDPNDKLEFMATLIRIATEGRRLTPMEVVKANQFLENNKVAQ